MTDTLSFMFFAVGLCIPIAAVVSFRRGYKDGCLDAVSYLEKRGMIDEKELVKK